MSAFAASAEVRSPKRTPGQGSSVSRAGPSRLPFLNAFHLKRHDMGKTATCRCDPFSAMPQRPDIFRLSRFEQLYFSMLQAYIDAQL